MPRLGSGLLGTSASLLPSNGLAFGHAGSLKSFSVVNLHYTQVVRPLLASRKAQHVTKQSTHEMVKSIDENSVLILIGP